MRATSTRDDVIDQVRRLYGLQAADAELIRQSVNDTYRVRAAEGDLFLRLYRSSAYFGTTAEDFRFELELLVHLAARELPVASPIRDCRGELLSEVEVSGQRRHAALFPAAAGVPHGAWWPQIGDESVVRGLGELLARMHREAQSFASSGSRYAFDLRFMLDEPLRLLAERLGARGRLTELDFFRDTAEALRDVVGRLGKSADVYGVIHGDAHVGNVLYDEAAGFHLIDFDHCAYGWLVYDLVPFLTTLRKNVPDAAERVWSLVLEGYETLRPLSDPERESIPAFEVLWYLWDIGEMLVLSSTWGGPIAADDATLTQEQHLDQVLATLERASSSWRG